MNEYQLSERRASGLMSMSRSQLNYQSQKKEDGKIAGEILRIKGQRQYYGAPRVLHHLRREGFIINGKRVRRILRDLNLLVPKKKSSKKCYIVQSDKKPISHIVGEVWSMDFVTHRLVDGSTFRCFTIIDNLSREVPGILAKRSMEGFAPVDFLEKLRLEGKQPKHIIVDNGPEFTNLPFVNWCKKNEVSLHFIDPGKPVQNAYIESFNGKFRIEFLNEHRFTSVADVQRKLDTWLHFYNYERPHSSLDYLTPKEFVTQQLAC
jgi:putative transposase